VLLNQPPAALLYSPDVEHIEADEADTARELRETMQKIREKTFADGGHALRSVHAKSHGILEGVLEVYGDLHPVVAQGLFAAPGRYPVVMRLSTIPGDLLDDSVSTPRGLAIKVIGVEGERLPESEDEVTQNFVLVNGPAFAVPNAKAFLGNLKLLAATTDQIEGVKKIASAALRGLNSVVEATTGHPNPTLANLGGQPATHILGETFYSAVPVRWGDYIAKLAVVPVSPELKALEAVHVKYGASPNVLREAVVEFFAHHGAQWEVRAQMATDLEHTPVENAAKVWDEEKSPYIPVGRITAPSQTAWSEARSRRVDDGMYFSVWHGLLAHQPLGSIMRVRQQAYEQSARFRAEHGGGDPLREPRQAVELPV
jgi:hypothetical protein